jgi:hypothetical protein
MTRWASWEVGRPDGCRGRVRYSRSGHAAQGSAPGTRQEAKGHAFAKRNRPLRLRRCPLRRNHHPWPHLSRLPSRRAGCCWISPCSTCRGRYLAPAAAYRVAPVDQDSLGSEAQAAVGLYEDPQERGVMRDGVPASRQQGQDCGRFGQGRSGILSLPCTHGSGFEISRCD